MFCREHQNRQMSYAGTPNRRTGSLQRRLSAAIACSFLICTPVRCTRALEKKPQPVERPQNAKAPPSGSSKGIPAVTNEASAKSSARENAELWRRALGGVQLQDMTLEDFQQVQPKTAQKKTKRAQDKQAPPGSPGHIFWVVPAYKVEYGQNFKPLSPKEKFQEWAQAEYDPLGLGVGAFEAATIEHSSTDGFCGYGHGWGGYGECFGSLELDATDSSFLGDFVLPVWWHQDPRYFRLGEHSFGVRLWYAVSRVFVTYNDSGHTVFDSSALTGTVVAAGLSNLYYAPQDVGFGHTMSRIAIDLGNTALYNFAAEFWPDIHTAVDNVAHKIVHAF